MINADEFEHNDIVYKNTERNFEEKGAMVSFVVRFGSLVQSSSGHSQ